MKITKIGHCCLVLEVGTVKIVTDPGMWTTEQNQLQNVSAVVITHEHGDHFHLESVQAILKNNPEAQVITNHTVGTLLEAAGIAYTLVEDTQTTTVGADVKITGVGTTHAEIYPGLPAMSNTGYFITDQFFYPGDALTVPSTPVEILAVPMAGPWLKTSEAVDYALAVKPKVCLPVHDGMLKITDFYYRLMQQFLGKADIHFVALGDGERYDS